MAFTHTPFPEINSASSTRHLGQSNPTRPFRVVRKYLEDIFQDYLHLASLNTTVEKVEKRDGKWTLVLRQSGHGDGNTSKDYWWEEQFDAVIVASGHYSVPFVPFVPGLDAAFARYPTAFEHSKAFRKADDYVDKRVVVVGGSVSSADLVADLHAIVKGPLELSQRGKNEALQSAWDLPNVNARPTIKEIQATEKGINVVFSDNSLFGGCGQDHFRHWVQTVLSIHCPKPRDPQQPGSRVLPAHFQNWGSIFGSGRPGPRCDQLPGL
jgi:Predicted flavoprotein involved in K+ transport